VDREQSRAPGEDIWLDFRTSTSGRRMFKSRVETSALEQQAILLFAKYELYRAAGFVRGRDKYYERYVNCLLRITNG